VGQLRVDGVRVLAVRGRGALQALDRLVTQDLKGLSESQGTSALLLTPKGRFRALVAVFRLRDEVLVAMPPGGGDDPAEVLSRYLALSRVTLEPLALGGTALCVIGPLGTEALGGLDCDLGDVAGGGAATVTLAGRDVTILGETFAGRPGATLLSADAAALEEVRRVLTDRGVRGISAAALDLARIGTGCPAPGKELTDAVLPQEVGLDRTVSYDKGCYLGQETMARLRTYGHVNRTLVGVRQSDGVPWVPSTPLDLQAPDDARVRGVLTSWGRHPDEGGVGLAIVRRELSSDGQRLIGGGRTLEVAHLPLF
jgi:folate-binding protein YgfZ